ncbi:glycosyltransferase family 87 protein [Longispora albida]|uniref:glycosyltransferase family 87 protein n=1 Tax=Longispora albida TaxID=203523 RepID=UPI0003A69085|nr:glycosyltransferase family 87 protein [Longispora albida]
MWYLASRFGGQHHLFDLRIYRSATAYWLGGHDIYDYAQPDVVNGWLGFTYPPFAALLLSPAALLPWGFVKWFTIGSTLAVTLLTTYWITRDLAQRRRWPVWFTACVGTALLFALEPVRENMSFGQINMYLVALILGDLLVLGRRGSRWTGVGVGIATAIKLTPGIFILYLLAARRWRDATVASAAAAGATLLAAVADWDISWRFYTATLWDTERVGFPDNPGNQAINGMVARIDDMVPVSTTGRLTWLGLAVLVGGYGLWRAVRAHRAGDELTAITLTGLTGVLISPVSWTHHLYWIFPAMVITADVLLDGLPRRGERAAWWGRLSLVNATYWAFTMSFVWFFRRSPANHSRNNLPSVLGENAFVLLLLLLLVATPIRPGADTPPSSPESSSEDVPDDVDADLVTYPDIGRAVSREPVQLVETS